MGGKCQAFVGPGSMQSVCGKIINFVGHVQVIPLNVYEYHTELFVVKVILFSSSVSYLQSSFVALVLSVQRMVEFCSYVFRKMDLRYRFIDQYNYREQKIGNHVRKRLVISENVIRN